MRLVAGGLHLDLHGVTTFASALGRLHLAAVAHKLERGLAHLLHGHLAYRARNGDSLVGLCLLAELGRRAVHHRRAHLHRVVAFADLELHLLGAGEIAHARDGDGRRPNFDVVAVLQRVVGALLQLHLANLQRESGADLGARVLLRLDCRGLGAGDLPLRNVERERFRASEVALAVHEDIGSSHLDVVIVAERIIRAFDEPLLLVRELRRGLDGCPRVMLFAYRACARPVDVDWHDLELDLLLSLEIALTRDDLSALAGFDRFLLFLVLRSPAGARRGDGEVFAFLELYAIKGHLRDRFYDLAGAGLGRNSGLHLGEFGAHDLVR